MKVAVSGCCHGDLDILYDAVRRNAVETGKMADMLLCCGDFQAIRDLSDLECLACPKVYRRMGDFVKYYEGKCLAPILTIFIGGNHEASNVLRELYYGGWVAQNIFYLGQSGVIRVSRDGQNFLRIAGFSGIYKEHDYNKASVSVKSARDLRFLLSGYFETIPLNENSMRSIYHIRKFDTDKLALIREPLDIFMSHDWPRGVTRFGNWQRLLKYKPHFKMEVAQNSLGSSAGEYLMSHLQPFDAEVIHELTGTKTRFLALDKPLPRRQYIEFIDINVVTKITALGSNSSPRVSSANPMAREPSAGSQSAMPTSSDPCQPASTDGKEGASSVDEQAASMVYSNTAEIYYDLEWLSILRENNEVIPLGAWPNRYEIRTPTEATHKIVEEKLEKLSGNSLFSTAKWQCWSEDLKNLSMQRKDILNLLEIKDTLFAGLADAKLFFRDKRALPVSKIPPSTRRKGDERQYPSAAPESQLESQRMASNMLEEEELDIDYAV